MSSTLDMMPGDQAVNLIARDDNDSAILDKKNLRHILLETKARNYPVAFYSICGSKRTGKSFLWNQFIRYLKNKNEFLKDIDSDKSINKYFEWKAGVERHTEGILVYKEPFIVETSEHGEVALFLMDTQGMFDNIESGENCGMIVALSFLISSVQVFNVHHGIESCHLQYSYKFSKVWKVVTEEEKSEEPSLTSNSLVFVVRDWKRKRTHKLGLDGGQNYVENLMEIKDSQAEDQRHVRREINDNFIGVSACLLPEPGDDIVDGDPDSTDCYFNDITQPFYHNIQNLFEYLCRRENVVVKTVKGKLIKGKELYEDIVQTAEKGEGFAGVSENFRSFVEHDYKMEIRKIIVKILSSYIEEMCNKFKDHVENDTFEWQKLIKANRDAEGDQSLKQFKHSFERGEGTCENQNSDMQGEDGIDKLSFSESSKEHDSEFKNKVERTLKTLENSINHRWKPFLEKLLKKRQAMTESETNKTVWSEVLKEHHTNLKNKALDEYDQTSKPGDETFRQRWRSILENLIDRNYDGFQHCAEAEEIFEKLLLEYNAELRSDAKGERFKRTFSPLDSAKERSKNALEKCKEKLHDEINSSIAEQCFEFFKEKAKILLDEHRRVIKRRIGITVAATAAVVGAGAAATLFAIPAILAGAIASEVSTALIISATVGGGATLASAAGGAGTAIKLYHKHVHSLLEENWDYDGDDIGFFKADIEVLLSFGIVRFPQVTKLEKK